MRDRSFAEDFDDLLPATPLLDDETPFSTMMSSFDEAAFKLGIDPDAYAVLRKPDREIHLGLPVKLDDGSLAVLEGYRIQHNAGLGPFIGPLRMNKNLKVDELRALAAWMTWKCALLAIPFGGAAGGIRMTPKHHSMEELERAVRRYTAMLMADIGPDRDVFCADGDDEERMMSWIVDTVSSHVRHAENAVVAGKPPCLMGTHGHRDAVAQGIKVVLRLAVSYFDLERFGLKCLVQGCGTVGGNLARLLHEDGQLVVGLSDVYGAYYNENGLDIPAMLAWRGEHGSLRGHAGDFEEISNEEMMTRTCDVMFPCAVPNAIHSRNAQRIETKLIVEGAHGPVSARGDRILEERGIPVVPDILANGGGVLVNYFEWVQNRTGYKWIDAVIQKRLRRFMTEAWTETIHIREEADVRMRMAANMLAVKRVSEADRLRGIYA